MYLLGKNLHLNGPTQFKPMLSKGELYAILTREIQLSSIYELTKSLEIRKLKIHVFYLKVLLNSKEQFSYV